MRKRKHLECGKHGCKEPPYLGGLCKRHHDEYLNRENRRSAAIDALHFGKVGGTYLGNEYLRKELDGIQRWWHRACDAVNYQRDDDILRDEAQFALEWCIALAQEIVDAEILFREGKGLPQSFAFTQSWVWERFRNLESGLMSNGVERRN